MSKINEEIQSQIKRHEIDCLMYDIQHCGYLVLPLRKLYRIFDVGNRAKGTWIELLDAWETIGGDREELHISEYPNETLFITTRKTEPVQNWAGEIKE